MAIYDLNTAVYWTAGGWPVHILPTLPGNTSSTDFLCCSDDGTIAIVECTPSNDGLQTGPIEYRVVTNGVFTSTIAPLTIQGTTIVPRACSSDASIILGYTSGYWTESGAVGHEFTPPTNGVVPYIPYFDWYSPMSSDGTVVYGMGLATGGAAWTNFIPSTYSSSDYLYFEPDDECGGSLDGSTVVLVGVSAPGTTDVGFIRLSDGIFRRLTLSGLAGFFPISRGITADGSVIWGTTGSNDELFYWDSLNTVDGFGRHGVVHTISTLVQDISNQIAVDASSPPICFGPGAFGDGNLYKVIATTLNILPPLGTDVTASFASCSGSGDIASGFSGASDFTITTVFWDNDLVPHALVEPVGARAHSTTPGKVSRNGSVIFGTSVFEVTIPDPPPPTPPPPPPVLVKLFPTDFNAGDYFIIDTSGRNADFPSTFAQFSINLWCCKQITLRWPIEVDGTAFGLLEMTPSAVHAEFRNASFDLLFSGTFHNPGSPVDLYNIAFAIDTEAQTVACFGNSVEWTSTDATFPQTGDIGNVS